MDKAALSEYAYARIGRGDQERSVNLAPWLTRRADVESLPADACYSYQGAELDRLHAAHPRARVAPPYRTATLFVRSSDGHGHAAPFLDIFTEVVLFLADGYFVGFVTMYQTGEWEAPHYGILLWVKEAGALLARDGYMTMQLLHEFTAP